MTSVKNSGRQDPLGRIPGLLPSAPAPPAEADVVGTSWGGHGADSMHTLPPTEATGLGLKVSLPQAFGMPLF